MERLKNYFQCFQQLLTKRAYDGNSSELHFSDFNGDMIASFVDVDGTVTGIPGSRVLRHHPFHVTSACTYWYNANLAICPHKYAQVHGKGCLLFLVSVVCFRNVISRVRVYGCRM